ncbi:cornifelin homolog [Eurytemora carolleeae]|uniref:cornifelin homolog n=1 Tax=Eurytemora carolleeae TaxID=1294199 RepID=UPI000C78BC35|nr:cornifelin homolog [Eurytemora carolleeae]|eukprot:XP_023323114.1 cornifelin homolog [Eurytemora affinis]
MELVQNEWQSGVCGCCGDIKICFKGFCCNGLMWMTCENAEKAGHDELTWALLSCLIPSLASPLIRTATREMYGIEGSVVSDWIFGCFCTNCVNTQMAMEHKARNA